MKEVDRKREIEKNIAVPRKNSRVPNIIEILPFPSVLFEKKKKKSKLYKVVAADLKTLCRSKRGSLKP